MRGFPPIIGSRQDLKNLLAMPEHAEAARAKLAEMEDARMVWVVTGTVGEGKAGETGTNFKVVDSEVDGQPVRLQMELKEDPGSPFVRLGLAELAAAGAEKEVDHA
jgi:hypothetical protein